MLAFSKFATWTALVATSLSTPLGPLDPTTWENDTDFRPGKHVYSINVILNPADEKKFNTGGEYTKDLTDLSRPFVKWEHNRRNMHDLRVYFHKSPPDYIHPTFLNMWTMGFGNDEPEPRKHDVVSYMHPLSGSEDIPATWEIHKIATSWVDPPTRRRPSFTDRWDGWTIGKNDFVGAYDPLTKRIGYDWLLNPDSQMFRLCVEEKKECEKMAKKAKGVRANLQLSLLPDIQVPTDPFHRPDKPPKNQK